jgi:phosphate-selective porin OprO/OprP
MPHVVSAQTATTESATDARIKAIEQQIQALQEELERVKKDLGAKDEQLKQSREETRQVQEEVKAAAAKAETEKPLVSFPHGRPTISSDDGRYSLAIGTLVQFDVGAYFQNSPNGTDNRQPVGARDLSTMAKTCAAAASSSSARSTTSR